MAQSSRFQFALEADLNEQLLIEHHSSGFQRCRGNSLLRLRPELMASLSALSKKTASLSLCDCHAPPTVANLLSEEWHSLVEGRISESDLIKR
jgi:hypothetical protein